MFDQDPSGRRVRLVEKLSELARSAPEGLHPKLVEFLEAKGVSTATMLQQGKY